MSSEPSNTRPTDATTREIATVPSSKPPTHPPEGEDSTGGASSAVRPKREERTYGEPEIALGLIAYAEHGSYRAAERATGIPAETIRGWVKGGKHEDKLARIRAEFTREWEVTLPARARRQIDVEFLALERAEQVLNGTLPDGVDGKLVAAILRESVKAGEVYQRRLMPGSSEESGDVGGIHVTVNRTQGVAARPKLVEA